MASSNAPNRTQRLAAARNAARARARLVEDLERLCADAGITIEALAKGAGVPASYLRRIVSGNARPSIETYAKLAEPLGADLATRLYPNTGPLLRDRHQAKIVEFLIRHLHPRWRVATEVGVRRPARGWIDVVLHDPASQTMVACELESDIRRIEQQVRWGQMKAASLPSSDIWPAEAPPVTVDRLLIVRDTRASRGIADAFGEQLRTAYPAHPEDALAALQGTARWPGSALIWIRLDSRGVRWLSGR